MKKYAHLLDEYPEQINKEQFFRICKISKWSAAYLLKNGLVPCINNGKATHQYTIAMRDVVTYLEAREKYPEKYFIPPRPRPGKQNPNPDGKLIEAPGYLAALKRHFTTELSGYEDVLDIRSVGRALGYSPSTILVWIEREQLKHISIGKKFMVPKEYLFDFMMSEKYRGIMQKSAVHSALMRRFQDNE